jgi:hypothetical protein
LIELAVEMAPTPDSRKPRQSRPATCQEIKIRIWIRALIARTGVAKTTIFMGYNGSGGGIIDFARHAIAITNAPSCTGAISYDIV